MHTIELKLQSLLCDDDEGKLTAFFPLRLQFVHAHLTTHYLSHKLRTLLLFSVLPVCLFPSLSTSLTPPIITCNLQNLNCSRP